MEYSEFNEMFHHVRRHLVQKHEIDRMKWQMRVKWKM